MTGQQRIAKFILVSSMLIMGACGLMYEYVLSVMGNYLMGTSHEQIFIIIGLMLFAMGIGSLTQRIFTGYLLETFLLIEIFIGLLGGYSGIAIYAAHASWESFEIILYSFAFLVGALIGMEIPVLIRINEQYSESLRVNLSEILSMDYIGSLLGAFLFTYVLLLHFSLAKIGFLLGLANASLALLGIIFFWKLMSWRYVVAAFLVFVIPALMAGYFLADDWSLQIEQRYYRDPIVFRKTTKFQHIVLTKRADRVNLYLNGHLQLSSMDEHIYHEYLVHVPMQLASTRKRVLVLGGGDGMAVREILKYSDVEQVVLVDIDPGVTELASKQKDLVALNNGSLRDAKVVKISPRGVKPGEVSDLGIINRRDIAFLDHHLYPVAKIHLVHLDADQFIANVEGKFDIVIIDFPDPGMLELAKLYSLDFYRNLNKRLHPHSLVSMQSGSPFYTREAFQCIGKTMERSGFHVLPYHGSVPSFMGDWGWHLAVPATRSIAEIKAKIADMAKISVSTIFITAEVLRASFVFGKNYFSGGEEIRINTKMNPILVHYYKNSWKKW